MIQVESLHHVSICVTDLALAKVFYGEVLGLPEIARPITEFPGAWYALGDRQVHLIVHEAPRTLRGTTAIDGRDGHFAFRVRDYDETAAHLRSRGVTFREHRHNSTPWEQIFVTDPDGNVIEFNVERS